MGILGLAPKLLSPKTLNSEFAGFLFKNLLFLLLVPILWQLKLHSATATAFGVGVETP